MSKASPQSPTSHLLITLAAIAIIIASLKLAQTLVVPFLLASFIAIILLGPLGWLKKRGIPHWMAVLLILLLTVIVVLLLSGLVGNSFQQFQASLPDYQAKLNNELGSLFTMLEKLGIDLSGSSLKTMLSPGRIMQLTGELLGNLGGLLANGVLILLAVMFILGEAPTFAAKLRRSFDNPEQALHKFTLFADSAKRYMALKAGISALTGCIVAAFLAIVGVEFAMLWGLLAFFLNFVPNIGSVLAAIPAILLSFIQHGTGTTLIVILGYAAVNVVIGNVIEPRFMGKGVGLSTLVVFLSLVFWGWVLGPVGMLLSVPLTMMVKIALDGNPDTAWLATLMGVTPDSTSKT